MPEKDLTILLNSIQPKLDTKTYVFCSLNKADYKIEKLEPKFIFEEDEGTTFVITKEVADENFIEYSGTYSLITCEVNSSLEAVGFLAAMTARLAEAAIPVNAVSAYHHDHLFVPKKDAGIAMEILNSFI